MEAMSVPVTAVVAIVVACIVLAMAVTDQEILSVPNKIKGKNVNGYNFEGERMVWRFLMSERNDSALLFHEIASSFGHKAESLVPGSS